VAVPKSERVSGGKVSGDNGYDSDSGTLFSGIANSEEILFLSSLKDLVASVDHRLDPILAALADGSRRLTGATGAAIAMWKDGAMVCRARSGTTAPPLGAQLNASTGISGECLRTGKVQHCCDTENDPLVDVEVCRSLDLRSIAVLPIHGWRGVNGILEVFSTTPRAFTEHHLKLLEQMASLAERARAAQPHGASPVAAKAPAEKQEPSGLLPASDRVGDVALAVVDRRSRPLVLGAIGIAAVFLVGFVIWLGWRGADDGDSKAHAASPTFAAATVTAHPAQGHLPDNDPVWKPNPGGETLVPLGTKPSAGVAVKLASKVEVVEGKRSTATRSLLAADAASLAAPLRARGSDAAGEANSSAGRSAPDVSAAAIEAPSIPSGPPSSSALNGVLSAKASLPALAVPVSQGISGGQVLHHVSPVYPAQAKSQRLEGRVVLDAVVSEDGTVGDVKVLQGPAVLAQSAMDAVRQWRYQPFTLDGRPIRRETTITIEFKYPTDAR
jgi:TonB family protein